MLAGVDEQTALVKSPDGWVVAGAGSVTVYAGGNVTGYAAGDTPAGLPE